MPKSKKSRKVPKAGKCQCVVMHTYDAYVTMGSWNISVHTCALCGVEHLQELIPLPGEKEFRGYGRN